MINIDISNGHIIVEHKTDNEEQLIDELISALDIIVADKQIINNNININDALEMRNSFLLKMLELPFSCVEYFE